MEVIILAGGLGTRLRPSIEKVPKCLAPVLGKPFLWYLFAYLSKYDVDKVILSVGYLRELVFEWVSGVSDHFSFEIDYAIESSPLGTGGGIKNAMTKVNGNNAIILNGDTLFCVDLNVFLEKHLTSRCDISLALKPFFNFDRYGSVEYDYSTFKIMSFKEKIFCEKGLINGGVYIINRQNTIFDNYPICFSFESFLQETCQSNRLNGVIQDVFFIDIGVPEDYKRAQHDLLNFNDII